MENKMFHILFNDTGLTGIDVPRTDNPEQLAEKFALLRKLKAAILQFDEQIRNAGDSQ